MKYLFWMGVCFVSLHSCFYTYGQNTHLERDVFTSSGGIGVATNQQTNVLWTIGESFAGYNEETGISVSSGYQQGEMLKITGIENTSLTVDFQVYPNPTHHILHLSRSTTNHAYSILLYNDFGSLIWNGILESGEKHARIPMTDYADGNYFLKVIDNQSNTHVNTYSILKAK